MTANSRPGLVIQSLTAICVVAAAAGIAGCIADGECSEHGKTRTFSLGEDVHINALSRMGDGPGISGKVVGVGEDGLVVVWEHDYSSESFVPNNQSSYPVAVTLHDVALIGGTLGQAMIVGAEGTVLGPTSDDGWAPIGPSGITADLWAVGEVHFDFEQWVVVAGDEVLLVRSPNGDWIQPPTPAGGWGQLRGVFGNASEVFVVGRGGVAWSSSEPGSSWIPEDTGVSADLIGGGVTVRVPYPGPEEPVVAVGADGTVVRHDEDGWHSLATGIDADIVDFDEGSLLTSDGRIYGFEDDGTLEYWLTLELEGGLRTFTWWGNRLAAVTADGIAHERDARCIIHDL